MIDLQKSRPSNPILIAQANNTSIINSLGINNIKIRGNLDEDAGEANSITSASYLKMLRNFQTLLQNNSQLQKTLKKVSQALKNHTLVIRLVKEAWKPNKAIDILNGEYTLTVLDIELGNDAALSSRLNVIISSMGRGDDLPRNLKPTIGAIKIIRGRDANDKKVYKATPQPATVRQTPSVGKITNSSDFSNTKQGIYNAAVAAGAKWPKLVVAQWALESDWGRSPSGKNNFFGIKGDGSSMSTQEQINGQYITITDSFKNYASVFDCVNDLVKMWYKDYKNYTGVHRASNAEAAAYMLKEQGYATDDNYSQKLISILRSL
jgi:flagellum-specific peptidoglycan hydrolase FlgJ